MKRLGFRVANGLKVAGLAKRIKDFIKNLFIFVLIIIKLLKLLTFKKEITKRDLI